MLTHCVRSAIYEYVEYPKLQHIAQQLPDEEKYPKRLFFIVPTWKEKPDVTRAMLQSVLVEAAQIPSHVIVLVNAGSDEEDDLFREVYEEHPCRDNIELRFLRQVGGKRQGMADCLYQLSMEEIDEGDIIALMDGDTVLGRDILSHCLPLFASNPKVDALTTDNIAVTKGHWMYRKWSVSYTHLTLPTNREV